ncbi:NHL repeat-containing protein [Gaopeijia maritima]|uniref:6-bladed beta-propeller n=1 Tax=Gaopeijia maritima TaxID=3119007 RepID=A0ABU9EDY3_9BACT
MRRTSPMTLVACRRFAALMSIVASAGACDGDPASEATETSHRDSAGIEIVSIAVDAPGAVWMRPDTANGLRIGTLDGPEPTRFGEVLGLVTRADGGVIVADVQTRELRAFDAAGTHLWTAGGIGDGPGEFAGIGAVGPFRGDSVVVFDNRADRLTFVGVDGVIGRSAPLEWPNRPFGFTSARDGALLARIFHFPDAGNLPGEGDDGAFRRDSVNFRWATPEADTGPALPGPIPDMEALVRVEGQEGMINVMALPSPWSRYAYATAAPGGAWVAVSDRFELLGYDLAGNLVRIVRAPGFDLTFTNDIVADTRDALLADAADTPAARRQVENRIELTPRPTTLPAFSALQVDAAGRLWVLSWHPGDAPPERAWVFESDGTFLGRVDLPLGVRLHAADVDAIWGVELDELDVPSVVRYPLISPE